MKRLLLAAATAIGVTLAATPPVIAQPTAGIVQTDARNEVAAALFAASATQAAADRANAELRAERNRILGLARRAQAGEAAARNELAVAQERYVAELASKDRAYAQEIAVFRSAVKDIGSTPEGAAALAKFNNGDWPGARSIMQQIVVARSRARNAAATIQEAADKRTLAVLSLEARARGEETTAAVIAIYEEVTRLDFGVLSDWVDLGRLYGDAGNLTGARLAAERAVALATDQWDRSVALDTLADVLLAQGDLSSALKLNQESLYIRRSLAESDPSSISRQREVAVSLKRLGDVQLKQGDIESAYQNFAALLDLTRRLATENPQNWLLQRDYCVSLETAGDVLFEKGDFRGAQLIFETELRVSTILRDSNPRSLDAQRFVSIVLIKLGDVLVQLNKLSEARARLEGALEIAQKLAAADPSSTTYQRSVSVVENSIGDLLVAQGDLTAARAMFQKSLDTRKRLAEANPSSAALLRDLIVSYVKMQDATGESTFAARALEVALGMQARGILANSDLPMIEDLRRRSVGSQ